MFYDLMALICKMKCLKGNDDEELLLMKVIDRNRCMLVLVLVFQDEKMRLACCSVVDEMFYKDDMEILVEALLMVVRRCWSRFGYGVWRFRCQVGECCL